MKVIKVFSLLFFLLILFILLINFNFLNMGTKKYHGTATIGIISSKQNEDKHTITLLKFRESLNNIDKIEIIVEDENVWNLIEVDRSYFVHYSWENEKMPVLTQIIINDEFKEIYSKYFNNQ